MQTIQMRRNFKAEKAIVYELETGELFIKYKMNN